MGILGVGACQKRASSRILSLGDPTQADGIQWDGQAPGAARLKLDHEHRTSWPGRTWRAPTGGAPGQLLLGAASAVQPCALSVTLVNGNSRKPLLAETVQPGRWRDYAVEVPAGRKTSWIESRLSPAEGAGCHWGPSALVPDELEEAPPNVLVLLGDTVRLDALGSYGGGPGSSPALDALAASGARFLQARAQSSWTIPSVASLFTSRWAHEVTGYENTMSEDVTTLSELLQSRGYATAGFVANILMPGDSSLAQGFDTYWAPPTEASLWTDALTLAERAAAWLHGGQRRPFFAYVHFVDPHSPYCPPDKRPKDPKAPIPGDMSSAFWGKIPFPQGADLEEWRRLYAEEVALLDRGVARVLAALDPEVRRRTLVVFVSDHGEEFFEHGFLGHGWSLYDELLRVPMILAGPGVPAGRSIPDPVGQIDLLPTIVGLTGTRVDPAISSSWRGVDLRPALEGKPLPGERTFLAQTTGYGPTRLSLQRGLTKAVLFNQEAGIARRPVTPSLVGAPRVAALLPREAVFDLESDPRELRNLADTPRGREVLGRAREILLRSVGANASGRWVAVRGPGSGGRLEGSVGYSGRLDLMVPFFLREGEGLEIRGDEVRLSLIDDGSARAWLVPDRPELTITGARIHVGAKALPSLAASSNPPEGAGWWSWQTAARARSEEPAAVNEQVRRLRALGYIH